MRIRMIRRRAAAVVGSALIALAATSAALAGSATAAQTSTSTVTFASLTDAGPTWILPFYSGAYSFFPNQAWWEYLMWRPLYWAGYRGTTNFNPDVSLANPPVWSTSASGHTVATITMRNYKWSDGAPVTTRDVEFWENLLKANKTNYANYVPGEYPDNVTSLAVLSPKTFRVTFNGTYSHQWLELAELSLITPLPQQAWDRTSAGGPIKNYDLTPSGARSVYNFLVSQAKDFSAYGSNPLWQTVDGPWKVQSYVPTTSYASLVRNKSYSGPNAPRFARLVELPFTSDTAEFNSLLAGQVDYGYVPYTDLTTIGRLRKSGFRISGWPQMTWNGLVLQYARKDAMGPVLHQLYIRQVLTYLTDMGGISKLWHGYASYASGPVPDPGGHSPLVTAFERTDPYPYNPARAVALLKSHGWTVRPGGESTCARPGTGATECGAGIRAGLPLILRALVVVGTPQLVQIIEAEQSAWSRVGIKTQITQGVGASALAESGACVGKATCPWDIFLGREFWPFSAPSFYPTGQLAFECGSFANDQNWCDPTTDRLINATLRSGVSALHQYENYMARQQPVIFLPMQDLRVSAVKSALRHTIPQDPYLGIYPEQW